MADDYNAWLDARIARTKELIVNAEEAIDAVATGNQMYQLDTGQSRILASKANLTSIRDHLRTLENRLAVLYQKRHGSASSVVRPGF